MSTNQFLLISEFENLNEDELSTLEIRWSEGRFLSYAECLHKFVMHNQSKILAIAANADRSVTLLAATKILIIERGSVDIAAELQDQLCEIKNELWYQGEKGNLDRTQVQSEWTAKYAVVWRRWRIREYLFVVDRCADSVLGILENSQQSQHGSNRT